MNVNTYILVCSLAAAFVGACGGAALENWRAKYVHRHVHDWGRWEQKETAAIHYVSVYGVTTDKQDYVAVWQERTCTSCGYIEREELELP